MAPLQEQIQSINERLRAFGIEAIQEIKMTDKGGNVIGQIKYGFRPQYVFDSVNEVLGPENWRYELTRGGSVCLDSFFFFLSGVSAFFRLPV